MTLCWMNVLRLPDCCTCVACVRPLPRLALGDVVCALVDGQELIGVICDGCLSPPSRAEVARLRAESIATGRRKVNA
jgi:hypothetical protein